MKMILHFSKYEGAGNDFVIVDARHVQFNPTQPQVSHLCDRRFGIGSDGFMLLEQDPDPECDFRMRYFNADGNEASMCGNGGRCIAWYAHRLGIGGRKKRFRGVDGLHDVEIVSADGDSATVALGMIRVNEIIRGADYYFLDTGSPQHVVFVEDLDAVKVCELGAAIRYGDRYNPIGGTNVNFVRIVSDGHIRVRTYERGVEDETYACGTGSTGSALAAAVHTNSTRRDFIVDVKGGRMRVSFQSSELQQFEHIVLTGPAREVYTGNIRLKI